MITKPQRNFLRKLANPLQATVLVGKQGLTEQILAKVERELAAHELIKLKYLEYKEQKRELTATIVAETGAVLVDLIGNVAILYRQQPDPDQRQIMLPPGGNPWEATA